MKKVNNNISTFPDNFLRVVIHNSGDPAESSPIEISASNREGDKSVENDKKVEFETFSLDRRIDLGGGSGGIQTPTTPQPTPQFANNNNTLNSTNIVDRNFTNTSFYLLNNTTTSPNPEFWTTLPTLWNSTSPLNNLSTTPSPLNSTNIVDRNFTNTSFYLLNNTTTSPNPEFWTTLPTLWNSTSPLNNLSTTPSPLITSPGQEYRYTTPIPLSPFWGMTTSGPASNFKTAVIIVQTTPIYNQSQSHNQLTIILASVIPGVVLFCTAIAGLFYIKRRNTSNLQLRPQTEITNARGMIQKNTTDATTALSNRSEESNNIDGEVTPPNTDGKRGWGVFASNSGTRLSPSLRSKNYDRKGKSFDGTNIKRSYTDSWFGNTRSDSFDASHSPQFKPKPSKKRTSLNLLLEKGSLKQCSNEIPEGQIPYDLFVKIMEISTVTYYEQSNGQILGRSKTVTLPIVQADIMKNMIAMVVKDDDLEKFHDHSNISGSNIKDYYESHRLSIDDFASKIQPKLIRDAVHSLLTNDKRFWPDNPAIVPAIIDKMNHYNAKAPRRVSVLTRTFSVTSQEDHSPQGKQINQSDITTSEQYDNPVSQLSIQGGIEDSGAGASPLIEFGDERLKTNHDLEKKIGNISPIASPRGKESPRGHPQPDSPNLAKYSAGALVIPNSNSISDGKLPISQAKDDKANQAIMDSTPFLSGGWLDDSKVEASTPNHGLIKATAQKCAIYLKSCSIQ